MRQFKKTNINSFIPFCDISVYQLFETPFVSRNKKRCSHKKEMMSCTNSNEVCSLSSECCSGVCIPPGQGLKHLGTSYCQ